jgi:NAD(P)-dependent dehydrogenase (short-subunit alcohol dehydrogenase family)
MNRKVSLVTGAGSGIGRAIACELAMRGFEVVVTDINAAAAESTSKLIPNSHYMMLDVTDPEQAINVANHTVEMYGSLDVWVSNAGISKMQKFLHVSPSDLFTTFEVNTFGTFYCGQAAAQTMIDKDIKGKIINIASMAAKQGKAPFLSDYIASKFAVLGLTQAMAVELAPHGILVNSICPGFVETPMQKRELEWEAQLRGCTPEEVMNMWISDTPLKRIETASDVAKVAAFLASDDSNFLTGESISVNGGAFMD